MKRVAKDRSFENSWTKIPALLSFHAGILLLHLRASSASDLCFCDLTCLLPDFTGFQRLERPAIHRISATRRVSKTGYGYPYLLDRLAWARGTAHLCGPSGQIHQDRIQTAIAHAPPLLGHRRERPRRESVVQTTRTGPCTSPQKSAQRLAA